MYINREVDPKVIRLEKLVRDVKSGDIRLPKFQRPFVWNSKDILKLLDSIYQGYPIGSLLLWLTTEKLASERRIGDVEINDRPNLYPTNYVLDGQQRLSTLCGALFFDGKNQKSKWNVVFDLEKEQFLYPKTAKTHYFPLNKLLETRDFIAQCSLFGTHPKAKIYTDVAQKLLNSLKDYNIAAVYIGNMDLKEVAPVFERINSSGRKLTIVDLMRAATWEDGAFDLNDAIEAVRNACESKNFYNIQEGHILRSIAAACNLGINKGDIDKLRGFDSNQLSKASSKCVKAYELAVDFLTSELPLSSLSYMPYKLQLTLLVEFFNLCPKPTNHQITALTKWFWETSFSMYFGTSNTGRIARDLKLIREFALLQTNEIIVDRDIRHDAFSLDSFALNKAASKSFALLLAQNNPRNLTDGSKLDIYASLAVINRHEFHHIFPQAFLKSRAVSNREINHHANICLLKSGANKQISDAPPSVYFLKLQNDLGDDFQEILDTNFISEDALLAALLDDYESFVDIRKTTIKENMDILVS